MTQDWLKKVLAAGVSGALACTMVVPGAGGVAQAAESEASSSATLSAAASASTDPTEMVTIIVELDTKQSASSRLFRLFSQTDVRSEVQEEAYSLSQQVLQSENAKQSKKSKKSKSAQSASQSVEVTHDYNNAIQGFSMTVPTGAVEGIAQIEGVKNAFLERTYKPMAEDEATSTETIEASNATALAMSGANEVSQTGASKVIAVIDTGIDTSHEVFSGDMEDSTLAWTEESITQKKTQLSQGGQKAKYVNEKIPFAYDYGDADTDTIGLDSSKLQGDHGTHVAGIAAANAGKITGTAPGAQLLAMRVARDRDGAMTDSAILAALDDCVVLQPDVINMSLGSDAGFYDEASNVYAEVFKKLESQGCTLCIAAGNAYYSTYKENVNNLPKASNPDVGTIATPAAHKESFAIASAANAAGETREVNDFSSWGVTPEMKLKPEITAPGGNIYSSVHNNEYGTKSGTSMSTPYMAGLAAVVKEYVDGDSKFVHMSASQKQDVITQLLMSTAEPIVNAEVAGSYYAPRQQGAGMANVKAATSTSVYLTVEDADDVSRPKAELGSSKEGSWSFNIVLHNLGDELRSFTPDTSALSELIEDGCFQQKSKNFAGEGIAVSYSGAAYDAATNTVSVAAGSTATYTVTINCEDSFKMAVSAAENGTFVEGFARLFSVDGGVDLSVPYLGFYGNWGDADAFDTQAGEGTASAGVSKISSISGSSVTTLGINPLKQMNPKDKDVDFSKLVISHASVKGSYISSSIAGLPATAVPYTGLLRNVEKLTYAYRDSGGKVVRSYTKSFVEKSLPFGGSIYSEVSGVSPAFDGLDANGDSLADGTYTLEETAIYAGGNGKQTVRRNIVLDTTDPQVSEVKASSDGENVTFTVTDASYLAAVDFVTSRPIDGEEDDVAEHCYYRLDGDKLSFATDSKGSHVYSVAISTKELEKAWTKDGNSGLLPDNLQIRVWDYGLNCTGVDSGSVIQPSDGFVIENGTLTAYKGTDTVVKIPSTVTAIADKAFYNTKVKSVSIPASVRSIGSRAFYQVETLRSVTFESDSKGNSALASIGDEAFASSGLTEFHLPDSVKEVGSRAFALLALKIADFGATETVVPRDVFEGGNPASVIMNGGENGSIYYSSAETGSDDTQMTSAVFGEETIRANFIWKDSGKTYAVAPPKVLKVSANMRRIDFPENEKKIDDLKTSAQDEDRSHVLRYDPTAVVIYAPSGTSGWNAAKKALESIGADPATQLKDVSQWQKDADSGSSDQVGETKKPSGSGESKTKPAAKPAAKTFTVNTATVTAKTVKAAAQKAGATTSSATSIMLGSKVKTVSAGAFKAYGKVTTVTLGKNVKTIKKNAFKGSKVRTLVVKTKKLSKKTIKGALAGSKVVTVKVALGSKKLNKKWVKTYKKIFTKKIAGKKPTLKY